MGGLTAGAGIALLAENEKSMAAAHAARHHPPEFVASTTQVTLGWAETIADLRTMSEGSNFESVTVEGYYTPGDGGGGIFYWTEDTTTPDDAGLVIVPAGSPRSGCWVRQVNHFLDIRWFGATQNNPNNAPEIQKAIDACGARGGGIVLFSPGRYQTTESIVVRYSGITILGCGESTIIASNGGFDSLVFKSVSGEYLYGNRLHDIRFEEDLKNGSGRMLYFERVAELVAERVSGFNGWNGIEFNQFNSIAIADFRLVDFRGGTGAAYLRLTSGSAPDQRCDLAWVENCLFSFGGTAKRDAARGMRGVDIAGFVHTVNLSKVGIGLSAAEALAIHNENNSHGVPSFITAYDLEIEFPIRECIRINVGEKLSFTGTVAHGSKEVDNIYIGPDGGSPGRQCKAINFTGGFSTGAWNSGIAIAGSDVTVSSMIFSSNNQGHPDTNVPPNFPGIIVGGQSRGVVVTGCRSGDTGTSRTQTFGCQIDTGADQFAVIGNVFTGNMTGGLINGAGSGTTKVIGLNAG